MIQGIDVSHHQGGGIVWPHVRASGRQFAFLKATQGETYVDPYFAHNRDAALSVGIQVGAYHFYNARESWTVQAHHLLTVVGDRRAGELPLCVDFEDEPGIAEVGPTAAGRQVLAMLDLLHEITGVRPILYADMSRINECLRNAEFAQYPLWLARYTKEQPAPPRPWKAITFWQNAEHGTVPGVYGDCDLDYFLGDEAALKALVKA